MAQQQLGEIEGTKAVVSALPLHPHQQHVDVLAGIRAAVALGTCSDDVVALEARRAAQTAGRAPTATGHTGAAGPSRTAGLAAAAGQPPHPAPPGRAPARRRPSPAPPGAVGRTAPPAPTAPEGFVMTAAHHALTAQAFDAAIDTACRMLRLPTIRSQAADTIARAERRRAFLPGLPRRAADGRVRGPRPPPGRTPHPGRPLPAREVTARRRLSRQPQRRPGRHPQPRHLRLDHQGLPPVSVRELRHRHIPPPDRPWAPPPPWPATSNSTAAAPRCSSRS